MTWNGDRDDTYHGLSSGLLPEGTKLLPEHISEDGLASVLLFSTIAFAYECFFIQIWGSESAIYFLVIAAHENASILPYIS